MKPLIRVCERKFEDKNNIFYPPSTNLLIIVKSDVDAEAWFPFELRIHWELCVNVHDNPFMQSIVKFVARIGQHEGWCFKIRGEYEPALAQEAMDKAQNLEETKVGLHEAIRPWQKARGT